MDDFEIVTRPSVSLCKPDGHMRRLGEVEADIIRLAVARYNGHLSEVARRLQISRSTLYRKLDIWQIDPRTLVSNAESLEDEGLSDDERDTRDAKIKAS